jgi:hypothetical protein
MRRLRRASWSLLVWLTAVSTLVANTPHMACACPQTVDTNATPQVHQCCCCCSKQISDSDSAVTENTKVEKKSCCHDEEPNSSDEPAPPPQDPPAKTNTTSGHDDPAWRLPGCRKAQTQSDNFTLESKEKDPKQSLSQFNQSHQVVLALSAPRARMEWDGYTLPPPTDLITLLQHLLI